MIYKARTQVPGICLVLLFQCRIKVLLNCSGSLWWNMGTLSFYLQLGPAAASLGWTEYLSVGSWPALSVWGSPSHHRREHPFIPEAFRSTLSTVKVYIHHCQLLPCSLTNSVMSSRLLFILWVCLLIGA